MNVYGPATKDTVISKTREKVDEPPLYKVLLHNDDYTTMEFVVEILMAVFNKSIEESTMIMLNVHRMGIGVCGVFVRQVAETKVNSVHTLARVRGFPLKCSMEKE
jgi:ATP-dependent Clp protease adaptor protein ClpS